MKLGKLMSLKKIRISGNYGIRESGFSVFGNFRKLEDLTLFDANVSNDQLLKLEGIETLKWIRLNRCPRVSGAGLAGLVQSKNVERLDVSGCRRINSDAMAVVCKFENLVELNLSGTLVKSDGIKQLKQLGKLEQLDLSRCNWVDDATIKVVSGFPSLKRLTLSRVPRLTDRALEHLANLDSLEQLEIKANGLITGAGFSAFGENSRLKVLALKNVGNLSANGLKNLRRFNALEELTIYLKQLPASKINALAGIPHLKSIDLNAEEGFDLEIYRELKSTLPELNPDD